MCGLTLKFPDALMWGLLVTVAGLPREVAMGALVVFLIVGRYLLGGVDDEQRSWSPEERGAVVAGAS